jgi:hypothetical protein
MYINYDETDKTYTFVVISTSFLMMFVVQATVAMTVNFDRNTFIVQATGVLGEHKS